MRAFALDAFGETGSFRDLPIPEPGEGEVLVRVRSADVCTTDFAVMAGYMAAYFEHRFPLVPGIDAAGVVERVGPGVDGFKPGDEVYGYQGRPIYQHGTLAEYVPLQARGIVHKPASLSFEQAGIIGHCALTGSAAVAAGELRPGQRVVLLGATGGVGSFATQFARAAGAHVIGVTRPEHLEYAREMGSSETIDYTVTDAVAAVSERYPDGVDVLIDLVGIQPLSAGMAELVHEGGRVVSVVMPPDVEALAARGVTGILTSRLATEHQLEQICSGVTDGSVKLPTIQAFPFDEIQAAYAMQATMHVQGKIAIAMAP